MNDSALSHTMRLAWRNLWRSKRRTWLTVGAMIFSNALLVFVITLQLGSYASMTENTLRLLSSHLQVQKRGYLEQPRMRNSFNQVAKLVQSLRRELATDSISARAEAFTLASSEQRSVGIQIVGVEPAHEPLVSSLPGLVKQGRWLSGANAAEIIIGKTLAKNLKIELGDELTFLGTARDGSMAAAIVHVVGILDTGHTDIDRQIAQIPLGYFQQVFALEDQAHRILFDAGEMAEVVTMQTRLLALVGARKELAVLDWNKLQPGLKQAIQADWVSAWFMYAVLILLVSLGVLNTQLMSVLERTREFGLMLALGIRPVRLASVVLLESCSMAAIALLIGLLVGGMVSVYFSIYGFYIPGVEEAMQRYNMSPRIYPLLSLGNILLGPLIVSCGAILASVYPALRLFWLEPVAAMRTV